MIITIDGPAASGKSSTARIIAQQRGLHHINSGLFYRAVAYLVLQNGYTMEQCAHVDEIPKDMLYCAITALNPFFLEYQWDDAGRSHMLFLDEDITSELLTDTIGQAASLVSKIPAVRNAIVVRLRQLADDMNCIIDGRDCGSVVFPHADLKIYLTAPLSVRAERWQKELQEKGVTISLLEAEQQLAQRDQRDAERLVNPLIIPDDAFVIDNGTMTQQETVEKIISCM